MKFRNETKYILICLVLMLFTVMIFSLYPIDLFIQDKLYDATNEKWLITRKVFSWHKLAFYTIPKNITLVIGVTSLCLFLASFIRIQYLNKLKPYRKNYLLVTIVIAMVPLTVAIGKQVTNIYCPYQLERYGNHAPYCKIIGICPNKNANKRGKCFPAGHASAGFALLVLYYAFNNKTLKTIGLSIGITFGCTMSLYQILNGSHFLSDSLITALLSLVIIHCSRLIYYSRI